MTVKHRKIGGFEYDYEITDESVLEDGVYIKKKFYEIIFKKVPGEEIAYYDRDHELLEFIHELEQSGELDKVKTEYIGGSDVTYPGITPYTWSINDDKYTTVLCCNNEHDAKTRTFSGESSNARTRLSSKNLSSQINRDKKNRYKKD